MFRPRQIAKKGEGPSSTSPRNASAPPTAGSSASSSTSHPIQPVDDDPPPPPPAPIASTWTAPTTVAPRPQETLSTKERERLQVLLSAIESSFSDWGLSTYQRQNGMLQRLKQDARQNVHLQHVIRLDPIIALTNNQADLQKALRYKCSPLVELDPNDHFQLHVKRTLDYERLENLTPNDWDPCTLYLEHVPSPNHHSLPLDDLLSEILRTQIQRIILPPGYDPSNPPSTVALQTRHSDRPITQSELFDQSRSSSKENDKGKGKGLRLPKGGGTFKGFAFVVVGNEMDAERVLREWDWEADDEEKHAEELDAEELESEIEREMGMEMQDQDQDQGGKEKVDLVKIAKKGGMRAITYSRWLELQAEYLIYQQALEGLKKQGYRNSSRSYGNEYDDREPILSKDLLPHLRMASSSSASASTSANSNKTKRPSTNELQSSTAPNKKPKIASETSTPAPAPRPGKPLPALDSRAALKIHGAYPLDCVLWVRNLHENSTKGSLRTLFSKLLDRLEEGSGKGCEFVDYEKGLESAKVRFSTPHHVELVRRHFEENPTKQTRRDHFSFMKDPMTPPSGEGEEGEGEGRRFVVAELLKGDLEREYWDKIPEEKRRDARKSAKVEVGIVGKKKTAGDVQAHAHAHGQRGSGGAVGAGGSGTEEEAVVNRDKKEEKGERTEVKDEQEKEKKRKRPSARF
ncbi:BQ2448_7780 [Microbotryum intermedium]|uniref:BQ2448_7780 protein n=1 Tax=Microbotryum intermedium TaxID=269621 RepID=A0A238FRB4_9BASI|nr:BQ2448_7780 [Microbotryum intermedium]